MNALERLNFNKDILKEVYYFSVSLEECVRRDRDRNRTVGSKVIDKMYRQLQIPTYAEGWSKIHLIHQSNANYSLAIREYFDNTINYAANYEYIFENVFCDIPPFSKIRDLPHDSKYHSFSVSRHTYHVWLEIQQKYDDPVLIWAALLHDVGKAHCKEFKEGAKYAQFLGHEFVSGQLACQFLNSLGYDDDFILKVVELVQLHMRLMGAGNSEKAINKLKSFVGEETFHRLQALYDADLKAK
jgi:putative nucleotidyltransferase with HDIG domain